jgi:lambda repressor-like predicted transcriptional regulator
LTGNQIVAAIKDKGTTMAEIARREGVSHTAVRRVVFGVDVIYRLRHVIAEVVGRPEEELWPDRPGKKKPARKKKEVKKKAA